MIRRCDLEVQRSLEAAIESRGNYRHSRRVALESDPDNARRYKIVLLVSSHEISNTEVERHTSRGLRNPLQ